MANEYCENCGKPIEKGSRFCEACGQPVKYTDGADTSREEKTGKSNSQVFFIIIAVALAIAVIGIVYLVNPADIFGHKLKPEQFNADDELIPPQEIEKEPVAEIASDQQIVQVTPSITSVPIQQVAPDRDVFYCVPSDGPTTLTISAVSASPVNEINLQWRLNVKTDGQTTEWEKITMLPSGNNQFSYTFDANVWDGTNNFYYPPLMGESWFEYQITLEDDFQTEVFRDVTFFPCAQ